MDSGKLDQRIRVERLVQTDDGAGGSEEGWSSVGEVWAKVVPLSGSEQVQADRQSGVVDYEITIWNGFTVTAADRVVWLTNGDMELNIRQVLDPGSRTAFVTLVAESGVAA